MLFTGYHPDHPGLMATGVPGSAGKGCGIQGGTGGQPRPSREPRVSRAANSFTTSVNRPPPRGSQTQETVDDDECKPHILELRPCDLQY